MHQHSFKFSFELLDNTIIKSLYDEKKFRHFMELHDYSDIDVIIPYALYSNSDKLDLIMKLDTDTRDISWTLQCNEKDKNEAENLKKELNINNENDPFKVIADVHAKLMNELTNLYNYIESHKFKYTLSYKILEKYSISPIYETNKENIANIFLEYCYVVAFKKNNIYNIGILNELKNIIVSTETKIDEETEKALKNINQIINFISIIKYNVDEIRNMRTEYLLKLNLGNVYRIFNISMIKVKNEYFLSAWIKTLGKFNKPFVPAVKGYHCTAKPYAKGREEKDIKFWWGNWSAGESMTMIFKYNGKEVFDPICNTKVTTMQSDDTRMINVDDKVYAYATDLYSISLFEPDKKEGLQYKTTFTIEKAIRGKNISIYRIDHAENKIYAFDWFYADKGIVILIYRMNENTKRLEFDRSKVVITFNENYPLSGEGSTIDNSKDFKGNTGVLPHLSFGTPFIRIKNNIYLGVGHIKIPNDYRLYKYKDNSNIANFRKNIHENFENKYGKYYVPHYGSAAFEDDPCAGYMYLMYFITYIENDINDPSKNKFLISDSYLPLNLQSPTEYEKYKFTLLFPMGILHENNEIIISGGYGDFDAALFKIETKEFEKLCRHDMSDLNMNNYEYKLLISDGNKKYVTDGTIPGNLTSSMNGGSEYKNKYIKYKTKYLSLKNQMLI